MTDPLIGQQLANFRVERLHGSGGMAQVYYGRDVILQRPVAIKVIHASQREKSAVARRFVQEARMMAKWRHDNIVQIYYADHHQDGFFYYVMEYVDGSDLASILSFYAEAGELVPVDDVLHIARSVASALDYAHRQGVIHRDVKPSNILVSEDDQRVMLGDFGLALDTRDKSRGEAFGTPHYISPEQARRSADATPQSDLYSLGVLLYEMLVGAVPFDDPSSAALALQHLNQPPPAPRGVNPELSKAAEAVLLKALEKDPRRRYQSGADLVSALEKALAGKSPAEAANVKTPLPPIPVGVPTIRRSKLSLAEVSKLKKKEKARRGRAGNRKPLPPPPPPPARKKSGLRYAPMLVIFALLIFLLGWSAGQGMLPGWPLARPSALAVNQPDPTLGAAPNSPTAAQPSATAILPSPSATFTATIPASPPPSPTETETQSPTLPATPGVVSITPTVRYPQGNLFTVYYNDSSFYLHNRSKVIRSVSGFSFERVTEDGQFANHFGGWEWQQYFDTSQPERCLRIEIYLSRIPYLLPAECQNRYLSTLQPSEKRDTLFWTTQEGSRQFRVLWMNEEVARCEIQAGRCDFYIP
ncbi:MAG: protein kinase domain-containing protein [Chloroflexota bacterium]